MMYNVYWEGGVYRTPNRRDGAIVGLRWIKEGRQVAAVLTWKNPTTGELRPMRSHSGVQGNGRSRSGSQLQIVLTEVCDEEGSRFCHRHAEGR